MSHSTGPQRAGELAGDEPSWAGARVRGGRGSGRSPILQRVDVDVVVADLEVGRCNGASRWVLMSVATTWPAAPICSSSQGRPFRCRRRSRGNASPGRSPGSASLRNVNGSHKRLRRLNPSTCSAVSKKPYVVGVVIPLMIWNGARTPSPVHGVRRPLMHGAEPPTLRVVAALLPSETGVMRRCRPLRSPGEERAVAEWARPTTPQGSSRQRRHAAPPRSVRCCGVDVHRSRHRSAHRPDPWSRTSTR